jgi:hypothetical protein
MKTTVLKPINTTNAIGKKKKKPKNIHKKDDENILSKDIDVEEDMKVLERMNERKILKPREELAHSSFTLKNLKFRPQKYKGNYLPYHLRWIFSNNVKSNEIVLLHEIEGLENEISRLKKMKMINRECRKLAKLPFGINANLCQCCHKLEKKKHECNHLYCGPGCPRKKADEAMANYMNAAKQMVLAQSNNINNNNNSNNNHLNLLQPHNVLMPHNQVMNQNVVVTYSDNIMNNINSGVGVLNNSGNNNNDNLFIRPLPINDYQQQNTNQYNTSIPQVKFGKIFGQTSAINNSSHLNNNDALNMNGNMLSNNFLGQKKKIFGTVNSVIKEKKSLFIIRSDNTNRTNPNNNSNSNNNTN